MKELILERERQSKKLATYPNILINFNPQGTALVFILYPLTKIWLEEAFPDRQRVTTVYIDAKNPNLEELDKGIVWHVVNLLTGLQQEDYHKLGKLTLQDVGRGQQYQLIE